MTDIKKSPVILVIDDELAGGDTPDEQRWNRAPVMETILKVADTLGYDDQQKKHITASVRFLPQYDESDGPRRGEECAENYLKTRNGDSEVPVLAFIDDRFYYGKGQEDYNERGMDIIASLGKNRKPGETPPAMVWISRGEAPDGMSSGEKIDFKWGVAKQPPKVIFELAKKPPRETSRGNFVANSKQALVHSLRDAFESIAGPPGQKPWKEWISERNKGREAGAAQKA